MKNRWLISIAVILALVMLLSGCGKKEKAAEEEPTTAMKPDREIVRDMHYQIRVTGDYKTWSLWPGHEEFEPGESPHGKLLTTYLNEIAINDLKSNHSQFSNGVIIVKENYSEDKELAAFTTMYKVEGYNPDGGDWFWTKFSTGWQPEVLGKVKSCVDCHNKNKDNDFIMMAEMPGAETAEEGEESEAAIEGEEGEEQ